jgi:RNA polymerase sigma factor (sigma-70 family)
VTRSEFDNWLTTDLNRIRRDILKKYRVPDIDADIAEFYLHAIQRLEEITDVAGYLYSWVYNRNFRYTRKDRKIVYMDVLPDTIADEETYDERIDRVYELVQELAIPEKRLYELYYVKGWTTRRIAKMHGISHTGVAKQLQRLQQSMKKEL